MKEFDTVQEIKSIAEKHGININADGEMLGHTIESKEFVEGYIAAIDDLMDGYLKIKGRFETKNDDGYLTITTVANPIDKNLCQNKFEIYVDESLKESQRSWN